MLRRKQESTFYCFSPPVMAATTFIIETGLAVYALWQGRQFLRTAPARVHQAVRLLMLGCLVFIVSTVAVSLLSPSTVSGILSIMCRFAVLLAVTLAFGVLPATVPKKK